MKDHELRYCLKIMANNRMHADSKKRRSSFLVALLFPAGDARRYARGESGA